MNRLSNPDLTILRKPNPVPAPKPAEETALAPVRIGIGSIARHDKAFVELYYAIEARRSRSGNRRGW